MTTRVAAVLPLLATFAPAQHLPQLGPVAFLVGEFEGKVQHSFGVLDESLVGEWSLGGTSIVIRTSSSLDGQRVYEDLRVISYDPEREVIRMRQWALGDLSIYDVRVGEGEAVLVETAHEGTNRPEWRYTYDLGDDGVVRYRLDEKRGDEFAQYLTGEFRRKLPDPGEEGPFGRVSERVELAGLDAELWRPAGDGPFPTVIFSPGGDARSPQGYSGFGRWFSSWGYAVAIVGFDTPDAESRAPMFERVAEALPEPCDRQRLVAAGHSRGAAAAVLASRASDAFAACVAIAPSGPESAEGGPPTLVVVGGEDRFLGGARALYETLGTPRCLVELADMDHMLAPPERGQEVLARATAFLLVHVGGDARYAERLRAEGAGISVRAHDGE